MRVLTAEKTLAAILADAKPEVIRLARHLGSSEPEEVYQRVCIAVWRMGSRFQDIRNPVAWMKKVARNAVFEMQRKRKSRVAKCATELDIEMDRVAVVSRPRRKPPAEIDLAVNRLPASEGTAVRACLLEGCRVRDFASRYCICLETVRTRIKRGRARLFRDTALVEAAREYWSE
jgi:RNA polymerase sigma factor (sigma-70 family)